MLYVIRLGFSEAGDTHRIESVLERALRGVETEILEGFDAFRNWAKKGILEDARLLFALPVSANGVNLDAVRTMGFLYDHSDCLSGTVGGLIVDGGGELFTKSTARQLVFAANRAGCSFPGRPLVEATGDLYNFNVISKVQGIGHYEAYARSCQELVRKLLDFQMPRQEEPDILVVHASNHTTSNTLLLWEMIKRGIWKKAAFTEISLRNGTVVDCSGCPYETCLHFGEKGDCLYGGVMVEKVYPAILKCDSIVLICPNYNDAVSANITAFINRLTALFRTNDFSRKKLYSLVVSGYSGGDIVAEQVIGAMCFNKNFILPGKGIMVETANDPGSITERLRIEQRAAAMGNRICE